MYVFVNLQIDSEIRLVLVWIGVMTVKIRPTVASLPLYQLAGSLGWSKSSVCFSKLQRRYLSRPVVSGSPFADERRVALQIPELTHSPAAWPLLALEETFIR